MSNCIEGDPEYRHLRSGRLRWRDGEKADGQRLLVLDKPSGMSSNAALQQA
jgi:tRNA U55 pseudouridine synthase TruB